MTVDNQSPPGSWEEEIKRMPWKFEDEVSKRINAALADIRLRGLWSQAAIIEREFVSLKAKIDYLKTEMVNEK